MTQTGLDCDTSIANKANTTTSAREVENVTVNRMSVVSADINNWSMDNSPIRKRGMRAILGSVQETTKNWPYPIPLPTCLIVSNQPDEIRGCNGKEAISTGQGYTKLIVWNSAAHHVLTDLGRTWGTKVTRPLLGKEHTANGYKYDILKIIEVASDSEYYLCGWLTESTRNVWLEVCQELNKQVASPEVMGLLLKSYLAEKMRHGTLSVCQSYRCVLANLDLSRSHF